MKKFKFRLQRVIEVRDVKKRQCQKELASSQEELAQREKLLEAASQESQASCEGLRRALKTAVKAGELTALDDWRNRQEEEVTMAAVKSEEQRQEVIRRRAALIIAAKEKKVLERLKERRLEEYRSEFLTEEQAFLDELGGRVGRSRKRDDTDREID